MKIDFPRESIPIELVEPNYKFLIDMHMHYERIQARGEFSYMKYAGFFLLASFAFIFMQNQGIVSDYLIGVIFIGISTLFILVMNMIFISSDLDWKLTQYANQGKEMEEQYQSIINSHYFRAFDAVKIDRFRLIVGFRMVPFIFVGIFTICAGIALAVKVSNNLAVFIGVVSAAVLIAATIILARTAKRSQLKF